MDGFPLVVGRLTSRAETGNLTEKGNKYNISGDTVTFTQTSGEGVEYWQYHYDLLNRLVAVKKNGTLISEYGYDPAGLRVVKKAHGETIHYIFEGTEPIYAKNVTTGKVLNYIFAGTKPIARVDGILGDSNSKKYWITTDHIGNYRAVTNDQSRVVWQSDYTPFGSQFEKSSDPDFEEWNGFTGKELDPDSGLMYFNARWYDADTGRFISEDPAMDPNSPNLFTYCRNNPLGITDPSGLVTVSVNGGTVDTDTGVFTPYSGYSGNLTVPYTTQLSSSNISSTLVTMQNAGLDVSTIRTAYTQYWNSLSDDFYTDPNAVQQNLKVLWMGIDILGPEAMPAYGWGSKGNHDDAASMNMVRTIQAAVGIGNPTGYFGNITLGKMQVLGFCNEILKDGKGTGKYYPVGQAAIHLLSKRMDQTINSDYIWPTTGKITSTYTLWRESNDPRYKSGPHRAIDIANRLGTPIVAIADGTVSNIYYSKVSGNVIEIDYGGGVMTAFHHLNGYADDISIGTQVSQGQVVGCVGSTGTASTGPHLHFELWMNGERVNPNDYLPSW